MALLGVGVAITTVMTADPTVISDDGPVVFRIGEMTAARAAHQATALPSGRVLITGGCAGDGCTPFHSSTEVYDPTSRTFRPAAPMTVPRASHTATRLQDGRVLVAGGCSGRGATASAEVYDEATERWTRVGEMTEPRCSHIAVPLLDGRVFIMGGGSGRLGDLRSAEIFDLATLTFSPLSGMRGNHYLATRLPDGRVLLTGGQGAGGEILASAELFDPAADSFEPTGDMRTARVKHAAAVLSDGRVLVIGGSDLRGYDDRFSSTEIYDPDAGTFSPGPDLRYGRHKIRDAVAALPSGAVMVAGGAGRPELYDPADEAFVPARGELGGPQMFATASVLESGDVLLLGGYDQRTRLAADAWIITPTAVDTPTPPEAAAQEAPRCFEVVAVGSEPALLSAIRGDTLVLTGKPYSRGIRDVVWWQAVLKSTEPRNRMQVEGIPWRPIGGDSIEVQLRLPGVRSQLMAQDSSGALRGYVRVTSDELGTPDARYPFAAEEIRCAEPSGASTLKTTEA